MRLIGIRHRSKKTKQGEARPTLIVIKEGDKMREIKLKEDDDELDFANGCFPVKWRDVKKWEDISEYNPRHCKWRKFKDDEEAPIFFQEGQIRIISKSQREVVTKVPTGFDGFKAGDTAVMILGGSGGLFQAKLSRQAQEIGAKVFSTPAVVLKEYRGDKTDEDHIKIIELYEKSPESFYLMRPRDIAVIKVKEALKIREDAQDERIKCEQRLYQRAKIQAFIGEQEGSMKDAYASLQANDVIYQNLLQEEKRCEKELKKAVHELPVWKEIFEGIKGCGEALTAKIVAPIGDIRRFPNASKFKKFCGVHVTDDGKFPRNRSGACSGYGEYPRLAIWWLVKEQFPKNNNVYWKDMIDRYRVSFREKHPVENNGKIKYSDAHILKMANWRTANRFAVWLYEEWTKIETN